MPDLSLTLRKLADHFRRMAVTYVAAAAAACLLAYLLFDATQPRVPPENQVKICYFADAFDTEAFDRFAPELFDGLTRGSSHPGLREVSFECLTYDEMSESDPNVPMILLSRLSVGDADLYVTSPAAARFILKTDAWQDWEPYLADPALGLYAEGALTVRDEDGTERTAALSAKYLSVLTERGCAFGTEDSYVFFSSATTNAADTVDALLAMIGMSREGGSA